jgi:hypothetical protein
MEINSIIDKARIATLITILNNIDAKILHAEMLEINKKLISGKMKMVNFLDHLMELQTINKKNQT